MYSNPTFDPNLLAGHDQTQVASRLQGPDTPTRAAAARPAAYRQRYFPGSTFKIITSAAVYDHHPGLATKVYPTLSALAAARRPPTCCTTSAARCAAGMLPELFTVSCNTGFGAVGLDLGARPCTPRPTASASTRPRRIDLPFAAQSVFPPAATFAQDQPGLAYSAIGQQNVQATPLEMAMVAGGHRRRRHDHDAPRPGPRHATPRTRWSAPTSPSRGCRPPRPARPPR